MTNYRFAPCFVASDRQLLPNWLQTRVADQWDGICRVDTDPPIDEPSTGDPVPPKPFDGGGSGEDDTSGLKSALEKERTQRKEYEQRLKMLEQTLGGVDPAKLKEMQAALEKQKELEDQINARLITEREKYERDLREKTQALTNENQKAQAELAEFKQRQRVHAEFLRGGGDDSDPGVFDDFYRSIQGELVPDEKGNYRIARGGSTLYLTHEHPWAEEGDSKRTGQPFELRDLIEESRRNYRKRFFKVANRASGSGTMGGSVGESGGKDWRNMSPAEKIKYGRELRSKGQ